MKMELARVLSLLPLVAACSATFESRPFAAADHDRIKNGVAYYDVQMAVVRYSFTQLTDKEGAFKGSAPDACVTTVQKEEIQALPDLAHRRVIVQHPSPFSASQLQVTLNANGTLAAVNSNTTPLTDKLLATVETAAKDRVFIAALPTMPPCNASPVITQVRPLADWGELH